MNKCVVYAVFGSELVEAVEEQDMDKTQYLTSSPHSVMKREFNSESEKQAYIQGLNDSFGWMESVCLDQDDDFDNELINYIESNRFYN